MELQLNKKPEENLSSASDNTDTVSPLLLSEEEQLRRLKLMEPDILSVCKTVGSKPVYNFFKRLFDIIASLVSLIILSPLFLAVSIIIRLETKGPAIYKQKRVMKNGKPFVMYKFRSMYIDADKRLGSVLSLNKGKNTLMFKADDDPRITPFGVKIRKHSIDELPQLINILLGQMSFVGPRPPLVREVIQYEKDWTIRLAVKGGLTCFWQIAARNDADFDFCLEQDKKYIRERSGWVDAKLIFRTICHVFSGTGY